MDKNAILYINSSEVSERHEARLSISGGISTIIYSSGIIKLTPDTAVIVKNGNPGYELCFDKNLLIQGKIVTDFGLIPVCTDTFEFERKNVQSGLHCYIKYRLVFENSEIFENNIEIICQKKNAE